MNSKKHKTILNHSYTESPSLNLSNNFTKTEINALFTKLGLNNGELSFKNLLDKNKIPYAYIGNGNIQLESSALIKTKQNKKYQGDFLANITDHGKIIFHLKYRSKIKFNNSDTKYFFIHRSEIAELKNIQNDLSIPLWISFCPINSLHLNRQTTFYLISLSGLLNFTKELYFYFNHFDEFNDIQILRIPYELLIKNESKILLKTKTHQILHNTLKEFSKKSILHNKKLKEDIALFLKENRNLDYRIIQKFCSQNSQYYSDKEILHHLNKLIDLPKKFDVDYTHLRLQ